MKTPGVDGTALDAFSDGVLLAAQALARSAAEALEAIDPDLNLTELRALNLLHRAGPLRLMDVADALDVTPTTATRVADRLAAGGAVERVRLSRDRREVHLAISSAGAGVVDAVETHRRRYLAVKLQGTAPSALAAAVDVLLAFAGDDPSVAVETA